MARERDAALRVEGDALALEQQALELLRAPLRAGADLAARVDHAVPRHAPVAERRERVADLARLAREPGQLGDLAVGRDAALRHPADHGIDARPARSAHGRDSTATSSPARASPGSTTFQ